MRSLRVAFATGALASAVVGGGLGLLLIWLATLITGSSDPWSVAWIVVAVSAVAVGAATYLAEGAVYRRSRERQRAIGEPWAYRED